MGCGPPNFVKTPGGCSRRISNLGRVFRGAVRRRSTVGCRTATGAVAPPGPMSRSRNCARARGRQSSILRNIGCRKDNRGGSSIACAAHSPCAPIMFGAWFTSLPGGPPFARGQKPSDWRRSSATGTVARPGWHPAREAPALGLGEDDEIAALDLELAAYLLDAPRGSGPTSVGALEARLLSAAP